MRGGTTRSVGAGEGLTDGVPEKLLDEELAQLDVLLGALRGRAEPGWGVEQRNTRELNSATAGHQSCGISGALEPPAWAADLFPVCWLA